MPTIFEFYYYIMMINIGPHIYPLGLGLVGMPAGSLDLVNSYSCHPPPFIPSFGCLFDFSPYLTERPLVSLLGPLYNPLSLKPTNLTISPLLSLLGRLLLWASSSFFIPISLEFSFLLLLALFHRNLVDFLLDRFRRALLRIEWLFGRFFGGYLLVFLRSNSWGYLFIFFLCSSLHHMNIYIKFGDLVAYLVFCNLLLLFVIDGLY